MILKRTSKLCKVFGFCHTGRKWGTFENLKGGADVISFFFFLCHVACGILVPRPGMEPQAVCNESTESYTGLLGISQFVFFWQ